MVIAAITSCTNTSNPSVMLGAALVAKKACELGLEVRHLNFMLQSKNYLMNCISKLVCKGQYDDPCYKTSYIFIYIWTIT